MRQKVILIIALLCAAAQGAWAQNPEVKYIEWSWDGSQVVETERTTADYVEQNRTDTNPVWGNGNTYVLKADRTCETVKIVGEAKLILCDGATLTCTKGIQVEKPNNAHLLIYSQTHGIYIRNGRKYTNK